MRLDHLLSRDLGACEGAGARTGAPPGSSRGPSGGPDGRTAREHAPWPVSAGARVRVPVGGWGVPALFLLLPARVRGVWWWGGGGMLSGSGAACPLCPASASSLLGGCGGVGGLVVNCIVDASIFVLCGVFLLCASRPGPAAVVVGSGAWFLPVLCVVFMGVRWMPWHQGPMKDVVDCDKPRGAVWRALIRGFPNGGTRRPSWGVTRV